MSSALRACARSLGFLMGYNKLILVIIKILQTSIAYCSTVEQYRTRSSTCMNLLHADMSKNRCACVFRKDKLLHQSSYINSVCDVFVHMTYRNTIQTTLTVHTLTVSTSWDDGVHWSFSQQSPMTPGLPTRHLETWLSFRESCSSELAYRCPVSTPRLGVPYLQSPAEWEICPSVSACFYNNNNNNNNNNRNNSFICIAARMLDYTISATQDSAYNITQIIIWT